MAVMGRVRGNRVHLRKHVSPTRPNIQAIQPLLYVTMGRSVPLEDGMGSECSTILSLASLGTLTFPPRIRLYSTKTLKPLGTLNYHKDGCQTVIFARLMHPTAFSANVGEEPSIANDDGSDEDEMNEEEKMARTRWVVGGGKDHRVSMWTLMSFNNSRT